MFAAKQYPSTCIKNEPVDDRSPQRLLTNNVNVPNTEEPIDLSFFHDRNENVPKGVNPVCNNNFIKVKPLEEITIPNENGDVPPMSFKKRKRKFAYTEDGKVIMVRDNYPTTTNSSTPKQLEVIKAAKSLFSKRTRTLYQWMYPNANKQQIKTAVAASWETLGNTEKEFYISQVLGRFGLSNSNLMVNPQLRSIKKLPPLPTICNTKPAGGSSSGCSTFPRNRNRTQELSTALSSIMPQKSGRTVRTDTFEDFEMYSERHKKRRGRPKLHPRRVRYPQPQDFQDDPELSQELEKFAIQFNLSKTEI